MRSGFAGVLLFAFMLPCYAQAQSAPADCDNSLASSPNDGSGKEYNLFKNMTNSARGCAKPSAVTYEKVEPAPTKAYARSAPAQAVSPKQEELDRSACRTEGENAAKAAHGLRPGEYDIFKNIGAVQSGEVEKFEQECMTQRGYRSVSR
jgi:hypothetical protein